MIKKGKGSDLGRDAETIVSIEDEDDDDDDDVE
jgi:hypothetical protein